MFTTILTHAKTLVLGGSVLCGGAAYGAHHYLQNHRDHRPDNRNTPVRIDHPDQGARTDRLDSHRHDNLDRHPDRFAGSRFDNPRFNPQR